MRLSKDDGDREESESITNQRNIIYDFIKENFDYENCYEYVDDGYTGANFNRPGFKNMISDIDDKKINLVITKNLARLGRNYIDTGEYIEKIFINKNVRYIAILDKVDNFEDRVTNDFVPLKGVFNELFCRETSKNIKKTKRKRMQEGFYACNTAPYGYKKDPEKQGKLIIDVYAAKIVKKIFMLKLEGYTDKKIAEELNKKQIPTPLEYLKVKGFSDDVNKIWTRTTVNRILRNIVYTGACVRGKTQNISYKTKKRIFVKSKDFIITENTHDAIISKEIFDQIHANNKYGITKDEVKEIETKFANYIHCAYCHKKMQKRKQNNKTNLHCLNNRLSDELCQFSDNYFYEQIEPLIIEEILKTFEKYFKDNILRERILKKYNSIKIQELTDKIKKQDMELRRIMFKVSQLYNDRLSGVINEEQYKEQYKILINNRKEIENNKKKLDLELDELKNSGIQQTSKKDIIKNLLKKIKKNDFTSEDAKEIIKNIEIGKGFIIIHFNFSDIEDKKISCCY